MPAEPWTVIGKQRWHRAIASGDVGSLVRVQPDWSRGTTFVWLGWIPPNRGGMDANGRGETAAEAKAGADVWLREQGLLP